MRAFLARLANGEARKAALAYVIPAVVAVGVALTPDSDGGTAITGQEWIGVAIAGLSCGTIVYAVPNRRTRDGAGTGD